MRVDSVIELQLACAVAGKTRFRSSVWSSALSIRNSAATALARFRPLSGTAVGFHASLETLLIEAIGVKQATEWLEQPLCLFAPPPLFELLAQGAWKHWMLEGSQVANASKTRHARGGISKLVQAMRYPPAPWLQKVAQQREACQSIYPSSFPDDSCRFMTSNDAQKLATFLRAHAAQTFPALTEDASSELSQTCDDPNLEQEVKREEQAGRGDSLFPSQGKGRCDPQAFPLGNSTPTPDPISTFVTL